MDTETQTLDLAELVDAAGVTPRTVRYYIQQGLLPSPGSTGPGARYGEGHLVRLRLIKRLQQQHLPLAEIRRRLEALTDEQVKALLAERESRPRSAVEYVRSVLAEPRMSYAGDAVQPPIAARPAAPTPTAPPPAEPEPGTLRSQWDRITFGPDLELHVRRPLSREQNKLVERLVAYARRLLEEETP